MIRIKLREPAKENLPYYRKPGLLKHYPLPGTMKKTVLPFYTQRPAHRFGVHRRGDGVVVQRFLPGQHLNGQLLQKEKAGCPGKGAPGPRKNTCPPA
jgi:hypothetical protein